MSNIEYETKKNQPTRFEGEFVHAHTGNPGSNWVAVPYLDVRPVSVWKYWRAQPPAPMSPDEVAFREATAHYTHPPEFEPLAREVWNAALEYARNQQA